MGPIEEKVRMVVGAKGGSGWSRLETLPDNVVEKLRRREFAIGEVIGERYRLKSLLGTGAMGQVFVAENMAIGVEVAVKLLKAELIANQEFRARFQKEAEAVGSISHQNVARFFDLVVGDPTFLVMEYVQGRTLQQAIELETRIPHDRALNIAVRLCWGLEAAHARGIVHRDLKPANIILTSDPEVGEQPKIIDFGLAKLAATTAKRELTRSGQIVGTPEYMAPEQIEGKNIDARADVYALGCVLYKMIAGQSPFAGEDDVQILYRQLHEKPKPLSERVAGIPPKVDEVLMRALAKKPADRYADTRELAEALAQAHERRRSTQRMRTEPIHRPRPSAPVALVAATTLAVGAVAGVLLGQNLSAKHAAPDHATPTENGVLIVLTRPDGATVEVDNHRWSQLTPAIVTGLAPGQHNVKISKPGFGVIERPFSITGDERANLYVPLPPLQHTLKIRTVPSGATVLIDNNVVAASTPTEIKVRSDEFYQVRIEKPGYEPLTKNITPDDKQEELELQLDEEKHPMGYLWIDTNGAAEVWLDGLDTGYTAPTFGLRVAVGAHTLELRDSAGKHSKPAKVDVKQGDSLHLVLDVK